MASAVNPDERLFARARAVMTKQSGALKKLID
jgi:hypothetical protein